MPTGQVKWFSERIKAGFITTDEGQKVFFDLKSIRPDDQDVIAGGKRVNLKIFKSRYGLSASDVSILRA